MATMPEPTWPGRIQDADGCGGNLCAVGLRPTVVSGILLRLLQYHFSDPNNIKDGQLKPYVWNKNRANTRIDVIPGFKFDPKRVDARPSLSVVRGQFSQQSVALNDAKILGLQSNGNFKGRDYLVMMNGVHEIHAIGKTSMEADRIAEEVFYRMVEYAPVMERDLSFSDFSVPAIGEQRKLELEQYLTPISVKWARSHEWNLDVLGSTLRNTLSDYFSFDEAN